MKLPKAPSVDRERGSVRKHAQHSRECPLAQWSARDEPSSRPRFGLVGMIYIYIYTYIYIYMVGGKDLI